MRKHMITVTHSEFATLFEEILDRRVCRPLLRFFYIPSERRRPLESLCQDRRKTISEIAVAIQCRFTSAYFQHAEIERAG